jgi:hypothetical protein
MGVHPRRDSFISGKKCPHDWEFAHQVQSGEDVRAGVAAGTFGNWQETGFTINLALNVSAWAGLGYGEAVGALIQNDGLEIPSDAALTREVEEKINTDPAQAAAAADLLGVVREFGLAPGRAARLSGLRPQRQPVGGRRLPSINNLK